MISPIIALPAGVQALLVLRLVFTGVSRRYPAFTVWMGFSAISMVALLALSSLHGEAFAMRGLPGSCWVWWCCSRHFLN